MLTQNSETEDFINKTQTLKQILSVNLIKLFNAISKYVIGHLKNVELHFVGW